MRKNYYLAALALPLMFAACTQEDLFENAQNPASQGTLKATFTIEESTTTRANWADNQMSFDGGDKFSLYWLGLGAGDGAGNALTYGDALSGYTNAVYGQETPNVFTSQSLIYQGKNIAVFPADLTHVSVKGIEIKVDEEQTANTIKNIPYISNVMDIFAHHNGQDNNKPGYEVKVKMAVKQAANVFDMKMSLKNHDKLLQAPFNLAIEKVVLKAKSGETAADMFANTADVVAVDAAPTKKGEIEWKVGNTTQKRETIVKQAQVKATADEDQLVSKAITRNTDGTYTVRFVVLPTDAVAIDETSVVEVHTNCGVVTLKSTDAEYPADPAEDYVAGDVFTNSKGDKFAIAEWFKTITTYEVNAGDETFKNEKVGKVLGRTIEVDMSKADLSSLDVENEAKIMHYVNLYKNISKKGDMVLNMTADNFEFSKATVDAVNALHTSAQTQNPQASITLNTNSKVNAIVLTTPGNVYEVARLNNNVKYILKAASEWSMNDNAVLAHCSSIENKGTLTIKGTVNSDVQQKLAIALTNNGTLKIGGNNTLQVAATLTNKSQIEIAQSQVLSFVNGSGSSVLEGTVNVNGQLYTTIGGVQLNGTVNNYYIIGASDAAGAGFLNNGVINVKENAIATYVADNTGSLTVNAKVVPACINLFNRTDEVVTNAGYEGKIRYDWNAEEDGNIVSKEDADKFTYVVVNQQLLTIGSELENVDIEFASGANCKITATEANEVRDVLVNAGAAVHVLSGNYLKCNVFTNNGELTLGGTIDTYSGALAGNGKVITVSNGQVK